MSEQRIQTIKIVWQGDEAKGKAIELTRAIADVDNTVDQLNSVMGENVRVETKLARSKKEITQAMRKEYSEANRLTRRYKNITAELRGQIDMTSMTAEQQEIYAAQMKLGAGATEEQRAAVARLVTQLQKQRVAAGKTSSSFRGMRGVAQNLGWQLQDTAVQLQMGTSAMVVLSQQGSQFASAFGPGGAILGAALAVGGAIGGTLMTAMKDGKEGMKELEKASEELGDVFVTQSGVVKGLTYEFSKLYEENKRLALLRMREKIDESTESLRVQKQAVQDLLKEVTFLTTARADAMRQMDASVRDKSLNIFLASLRDQSERVAKTYGITVGEVKKLSDAYAENKGNIEDLLVVTRQMQDEHSEGLSPALRKVLESLEVWSAKQKALKKQQELYNETLTGGTVAVKKHITSTSAHGGRLKDLAGKYNAMTKALGHTKEMQKIYDARLKSTQGRLKGTIESTEVAIHTYYSEKIALDESNEKLKSRIDLLKELNGFRPNKDMPVVGVGDFSNVTKAFEAQQQAQLAHNARVRAIQNTYDNDTTKRYNALLAEQGRYNAQSLKLTRDLEEAKVGAKNTMYLQQVSQYGTFNKDILSAQQKYAKDKEQHEATIESINSKQWKNEQEKNDMIKLANDQMSINQAEYAVKMGSVYASTFGAVTNSISATVDILTNGVQQVEEQTKNMTAIQKFMFFQQQSIAAAMAIIKGLQLGSELAATMGWAAPAGIAFGAAIGGAQAGAIMGTTVAGMFDEGGVIPSGQAGIVSEYGDELVGGTMVYNNSGSGLNVTGREDTATLLANKMKGNGGGIALNVQVMNYAKGVSHSVEQMDENTVRIIARQEFNKNIDKGVSDVLSAPNSKSSKSITRNYSTNRKV